MKNIHRYYYTGGAVSAWTPSVALQGSLPLLWLEADSNVATAGARQFHSPDKGFLSISDNVSLSTGDIGFTIGCWVYPDSTPSIMGIMSKDRVTGGNREFSLRYSASRFDFLVTGNGTTTATVTANNLGAPSTGKWYFVLAWHDATANTINIQVNNGAADSLAHTAGVFDGIADFVIGSRIEGTGEYFDGRVSRAFMTKRVLTAAEKTWLYNSGEGRLYGELGVAGTDGSALTTSLVSYWNDNEGDATDSGIDAHSTNDLTPTFAELSTNGTFASDTGWTKGTGWTIGSGVASCDGSQAAASDLEQNMGNVAGRRYSVTYTVSNYSAGGIRAKVLGALGTSRTANGTYVETITATAGTNSGVQADADFVGSVDNLSVKAVDIPAVNGPMETTAIDSIGTNHGRLTNMDAIAAWSTDVSSAIGSGYALTLDGVDDYVACGNLGNVTTFDFYVKSLATNQELFTLANSTATAVTVAGGTLTFGASLSASAITVDGVSKTAAEAGDLINDLAWHRVTFTLASVAASDVRLGTDSSAYGNIMLDEFKVGATNYYTFDDGPQSQIISNDDPVVSWESTEGNRYQLLQSTAAKRLLYVSNVHNSQPGIVGDRIDDLLRYAGQLTVTTEGTLVLAFKTGASAFTGDHTIFASADEAATNNWFQVGIDSAGKCFVETKVAGTVHRVTGDTVLSTSTAYTLVIGSNGTAWTMRVNGTAQSLTVTAGSNSGNWLGDVSGRDNVTLSALKTTSESEFSQVSHLTILLYGVDLTAASIAKVSQYTFDKYALNA